MHTNSHSPAANNFKECPSALFGKIAYVGEQRNDYKRALDMLSQAVVIYKGYLPALIEKAKGQMALKEWDDARETATRCLAVDATCIPAIAMDITLVLARSGNYAGLLKICGESILGTITSLLCMVTF